MKLQEAKLSFDLDAFVDLPPCLCGSAEFHTASVVNPFSQVLSCTREQC